MRDASSENRATASALRSPESESQPVQSLDDPDHTDERGDQREADRKPSDRREHRSRLGLRKIVCIVVRDEIVGRRVRDGEPHLVVTVLHDDDVVRLALESVAVAVDLLRSSVGARSWSTASQRADEEVHLEADREEEHEEDGDAVAQLARTENPGEHEDDERRTQPEPRSRAAWGVAI